MSRTRRFLTAALVAAVAVLVLLVLPPAPRDVSVSTPDDPLVLKGAFHVHTIRSDGGGTLDEVANAAADAGLDFVLFADHGDGRVVEPPAYRSGVLCVDGAEISTDQGHVAAVGARAAEYPLGGEARDAIEDIHRLGGMAIVTHPFSPRADLAWSAWDTPVDGMEWLNADSEWRDETPASLARAALGYWLRPAPAIARTFDRPESSLAKADEISSRRTLALVAGHDAHARIAHGGPGGFGRSLALPSYETMFRTVAIRVAVDQGPSGDAAADASVLLRALRHGRVFTAIDALAAPVRFAFRVRSGGAIGRPGDRIIPGPSLHLSVEADAPAGARLVVLHNGRELASGPPPRLEADVPPAPGAYRAEVRLEDAPGAPPVSWIVSSPIFIGVAAPEPPADAKPGPVLSELIAPAADETWTVEHSPDSTAVVAIAHDTGAVQFTYTLAPDRWASPYAALVRPVALPAGATFIELRVQAQAPMRVSIQLRSPAGGGDGRRWRRSIFVDPSERTVLIPLDDFRAISPATGPVPLDSVDSLLLVVDTVNADGRGQGSFTVLGAGVR